MADEHVFNSLQDVSLDAGKIANTGFIIHEVLPDHEKNVFTLAIHVLINFVCNRIDLHLAAFHKKTYVFFFLLQNK